MINNPNQNKQENFSAQNRQEIVRLQQLQKSLEILTQQRVQTESQAKEMEFALDELKSAKDDAIAYQSIGGIFIKKSKKFLLESTKDKKISLEIRAKSIRKQESRVKLQFEELRKKLQAIFEENK